MNINDFNFAGHKAIVRVDFNVPLDENGHVTDDTRIRGALPTLKKILADGGALIMMSHMGKPKGKVNAKLSLSQIVKNVSDALGVDVKFAKDAGKADAEVAALQGGEALLLENLPLLEQLGFACEDFGDGALLVREVPADLDAADTAATLEEIAETLRAGRSPEERREALLHTMACKAAIKAGDKSSPQELLALAEKILSGEVPPFCPHGRPCVLKLTRKELEKQFGRIV